jgi:acyl-CoA dehydrogenase
MDISLGVNREVRMDHDQLLALRDATTRFVVDQVQPVESAYLGRLHDAHEVRGELQRAARAAGVFAPQVPVGLGGLGLNRREQAVILEAAGHSLLGPLALNCAAPDEGNIHLLDVLATPAQRERYLVPLAAGAISSCFAMTEPPPGAGSDPSLLETRATREADMWTIHGRKWFITGAAQADFIICMARTGGAQGDRTGATMFLVPTDHPGVRITRVVGSLDQAFLGGHAELTFESCTVDDGAVLGDIDAGFANAQVRLGPARLTHCMRWLGIAQRSQTIAVRYAAMRHAFGSRLADLGMVQHLVAESEIDLTASRSLIAHAADVLDSGLPAGQITSIAKTFVADAVWRIVDRSIQICGSLGVSEDMPLGTFLREVRPFRIYDGPSETHKWAIARGVVRAAEGVLAHD